MAKGITLNAPDYSQWEATGTIIKAGGKTFQVAPEDILRDNGTPWWYFDEAQDISALTQIHGWRLPTPLEADLIASAVCYTTGCKVASPDILMRVLHLKKLGCGCSGGHGQSFFSQEIDTTVTYWTDSLRPCKEKFYSNMQSGIVYMLHDDIATLYSQLVENHGACIRLVREICG